MVQAIEVFARKTFLKLASAKCATNLVVLSDFGNFFEE